MLGPAVIAHQAQPRRFKILASGEGKRNARRNDENNKLTSASYVLLNLISRRSLNLLPHLRNRNPVSVELFSLFLLMLR
jgi:hypothetical protein